MNGTLKQKLIYEKSLGKSIKHCVVCDKPFEMKSNNSRYCSEECKKEARKAKMNSQKGK